jgi:O-antigen/teichoic acid export membrane protein
MTLRRNAIANYFGQAWVAIINIAFVPLYIRYLGIEAFGLIGIFAILQAWFSLLDMGMSQTLNREMARFLAKARSISSIRDLLHSLEIISCGVAILILAALWTFSESISVGWLRSEKYSSDAIAVIVVIIGFIVSIRLLEGLYRAALSGLQQQVALNIASVVLATVRAVGAVGVLMWIAPSIEVFFIWQGVVSLIGIILFMSLTYYFLPKRIRRPRFSTKDLRQIKGFAGEVMLINATQILLTYSDKIVLSKTTSLEIFGYYTLAGTISMVIYQATVPVSQAFYPKLSELFAAKNNLSIAKIYHQGSQFIGALVIPLALMLIFFGEKIIYLWSGNESLAESVAPVCALLAVGTMLNSLMHMPGILALSYGWSQYGVRQNVIGIILILPILPFVAQHFGLIGVAWLWIFLNLGYVLIGVQYIHSHLLPQENSYWYRYGLISPAAVATTVVAIFWSIEPVGLNRLWESGWMVMVFSTSILITGFSQPLLREALLKKIIK